MGDLFQRSAGGCRLTRSLAKGCAIPCDPQGGTANLGRGESRPILLCWPPDSRSRTCQCGESGLRAGRKRSGKQAFSRGDEGSMSKKYDIVVRKALRV